MFCSICCSRRRRSPCTRSPIPSDTAPSNLRNCSVLAHSCWRPAGRHRSAPAGRPANRTTAPGAAPGQPRPRPRGASHRCLGAGAAVGSDKLRRTAPPDRAPPMAQPQSGVFLMLLGLERRNHISQVAGRNKVHGHAPWSRPAPSPAKVSLNLKTFESLLALPETEMRQSSIRPPYSPATGSSAMAPAPVKSSASAMPARANSNSQPTP